IANLALNAIVISFAREEAAQALLGHIRLDCEEIASLTTGGEGRGVQIGREQLDVRALFLARGLLEKQHSDGIYLLSGRAPRDPDADAVALPPLFEHPRYDEARELLEGRSVAKETSDRYQ